MTRLRRKKKKKNEKLIRFNRRWRDNGKPIYALRERWGGGVEGQKQAATLQLYRYMQTRESFAIIHDAS